MITFLMSRIVLVKNGCKCDRQLIRFVEIAKGVMGGDSFSVIRRAGK